MNRRTVFFPPDLALALPMRRVAALRDEYEVMEDIDIGDKISVAKALYGQEVPGELADLLDETERLGGGHVMREAIVEGMMATGAATEAEVERLLARPPVRVALGVLQRAARGDEKARAALRRARKRLGRLVAGRVAYEATLGAPSIRYDDAQAMLLTAAREVHGDAIVATWFVRPKDGTVHIVVLHRGPAEEVAVESKVDGARAIVSRVRRPIACDTVAWDRGRIVFMLARATRLEAWTRAIARTRGPEERAALDRPGFTLKSLHERGDKWAEGASLPVGITSAEAVACELDDGARFGARGKRALSAMHKRVGRGGYLYRTSLRFGLDGDPVDESVDAMIELPGKLVVSIPKWRPLVRKAIEATRLFAAGSIPDDLVALAPFLQSDWRWIEVIGREAFHAAVRDGILVPARSSRAGEARHRKYGSMYVVHDLPGETAKYAVADDWALPAHDVPVEATMRWKLDVPRLVAVLRERMDLEPPSDLGDVSKGFEPVGILRVEGARLCYFLMLRAVSPSARGPVIRKMRRACKGGHCVILVGGERTLGGGLPEAHVSSAEAMGDPGVARAVVSGAEDAALANRLPGWRFGSAEKPLVILKARGEAWLLRVKLSITDNQLAMITALAEAPGAWVGSVAMGARISAHAALPDQVVRKARLDLGARVRQSFVDAGLPVPDALIAQLIEWDRTKGYRLGVGVAVR